MTTDPILFLSKTGYRQVTASTNANFSGPITSIGNTTFVASQTGSGSTFVMQTSPVLITPDLGTPSTLIGTNITGTATGLTAGTVTTNANLTGPITSIGNATSIASSINLPGNPTTTTQSAVDNSTKISTTAYADRNNVPHILYVSKSGNNSTGTGAIAAPYLTIQAALTAIGNSASAADVKKPHTVIIDSGSYDESLSIPQGRIISLLGFGTVTLGDGAGANWGSTTPRSITFTANTADVFGSDIKPALNIGVVNNGDATTTFVAESGCFLISGNLNIAGDGLSHTMNLNGVKLSGTITKTAAGLTNIQAWNSYFIGAINAGTATILERFFNCQFDSLITVDGYNLLFDCEVRAGMTVATIYNTLPPAGFNNTTFTGTFTGPANSLLLDGVSNYYFVTNGATLAGGATKVIREQVASATEIGIITTGTQTIAGSKTFSSTIVGSISSNAATVTTNANLTGPITSTGNATTIASQTGTGTTFAMSAGPTFTGTVTTGDIKTGNTTNTTATPWKLGGAVIATATLDTTQYIEVMINGAIVKLAVIV